jgi:P pilus assembly chaperone PapD
MKAQLKASFIAFFYTTLILPLQAEAAASINFSKYRFIFNDSNRKDSLMLTNTGLNTTNCNMSTVNFIMSEKGPIKLANSETEISNSANKLLRFSPRRVSLKANENQTVRISSRRKPNIIDGEFLSYLKINCTEETDPNSKSTEQLTIKPTKI